MRRLIVLAVLLFATVAGAETWDLAVQPPTDGEAGDIIEYKPHPWAWSVKERKLYTIVIVDGLTEEEVMELVEPDIEGDVMKSQRRYKIDHKDFPDVKVKTSITSKDLFYDKRDNVKRQKGERNASISPVE